MAISFSIRDWAAGRGLRGSAHRSGRSGSKRQLILEGLEGRITLTTDVWTGAAAVPAVQDYSWSNANNWSNKAPTSGQDLVFPSAAFIPAHAILNDLSNMTFGSIEIDAPGYTIGGDAISLTSATPLTANYGGVSDYNINTTLTANAVSVISVSVGELDINGTVTGSKGVDLTGGGTIGGTGQVPTLTAQGSVVQPGTLGVGQLSVQGIASLDQTSTFSTNINGPAAFGTLFTTGSATNPVTLIEPTLNVTVAPGYNPTPGTAFTIIQGAVVGEFNSLPPGSFYTPTPGGPTFRVTYDQGAVLTAVVPTTLSLSVQSGNPTSVFGESVTFTATISATGGTPTGTVTFDNNGVAIGNPVTVGTGGIAKLTTSQLPVGTNTITATYSGDSRFTSSTAPAFVQTVDQDTTTTTVSSTANPSAIGQNVTFTARVTPDSPGGGTPTGQVKFSDGADTLATLSLGGGVATYSTSTLSQGHHAISVTYNGDNNDYVGSVSTTLDQNVNQSLSTTTIDSSLNPSTFGQQVSFTAHVAASAGASGTPTGTVKFVDGVTTLATMPLDAGQATYNTTSLARGNHVITAQYSGDSQFAASTSSDVDQVVSQANTTTAVTPSPAASIPGQSVTFTALVTPTLGNGVPTGVVNFYDGSTFIGSMGLSSGSASISISNLTVGSHSITADYAGDGDDFIGSLSNPVIELVGGTTVALVPSDNPITFGQSVTFTATVAPAAAGGSVPTGSVTFMDGSQSLGTFPVDGSGVASVTTASLSGGTHAITAVYGGATGFAGSTSSETDEIVNPATTTTTVSPSVTNSSFGEAVTFTATVTGFVGTPVGSVKVTDGTTVLATVPVNAGGIATYSSSALAVGSHSLGFAYVGTASYSPSAASPTLTFAVSQASTTTALTASAATPLVGQSVTFTATVAPTAPGAGSPTGVVAFRDGSSVIGTVPVSGGVASLTVAFPAAGVSHVIVASYEGSTGYASSDSTGDTVSVARATTTATLIVTPNFVRKKAKSVTLEVSVPAEFIGGPVPTGSITFSIGKRKLRTVHLVNGSASVVVAVSKVTGQSVIGRYLGDTNYAAVASSTVHVTKKLLKAKPG